MSASKTTRSLTSLLFACTLLVAASGGGWFGITSNTKLSGSFWDPTVESITITKISPNSPAESQHLSVGDIIFEIDGVVVPGSKGSLIRSKMKKSVGESLPLKLKKPTGETYSALLTAAKKP